MGFEAGNEIAAGLRWPPDTPSMRGWDGNVDIRVEKAHPDFSRAERTVPRRGFRETSGFAERALARATAMTAVARREFRGACAERASARQSFSPGQAGLDGRLLQGGKLCASSPRSP